MALVLFNGMIFSSIALKSSGAETHAPITIAEITLLGLFDSLSIARLVDADHYEAHKKCANNVHFS